MGDAIRDLFMSVIKILYNYGGISQKIKFFSDVNLLQVHVLTGIHSVISMINPNRTKIVCTIGPATEAEECIEKLALAGMNVARLNFSHGEFSWHEGIIQKIRRVEKKTGKSISIMADLPGPKMRIGELSNEPVQLEKGQKFVLKIDDEPGDQNGVSVTFKKLPQVVKKGDRLFLNDGTIELIVDEVKSNETHCTVHTSGQLRSGKGLNLPGIDLGRSAFTGRDRECFGFAVKNGVDAVSQSFVDSVDDIQEIRKYAKQFNSQIMIIAKIERAGALTRFDDILKAADGIMIARGDLGVEIPIERITMIQKELIRKCNIAGKPVITATQMLESMIHDTRPTRAEATDVANAVLDGTDAVMLSGESAMGEFPVESVQMLVKIAAATENHRNSAHNPGEVVNPEPDRRISLIDMLSRNVQRSAEKLKASAILVPTTTGFTARMIARFRLPVRIHAVSLEYNTCKRLNFTYGVIPVQIDKRPADWSSFLKEKQKIWGIEPGVVIMTSGPSKHNPDINHKLEFIDLRD